MDFNVQVDDRYADALSGFSRFNTPLKIVTKARNELELTKDWIEHHAGIVGLENLLIADNASTLSEVHDIYHSYGPKLNWFSFAGYHDTIHMRSSFPALYQILAKYSRYVAFLDMDERLFAFTGTGWDAGPEVVKRVESSDSELISAPWLQNTSGKSDRFQFNKGQMEWGVLFGKPLVSTQHAFLGQDRIHTVQYPRYNTGYMSLGVLHLSQFSKEQRLRTNKNKLMARGIVGPDTSYEDIAAMSTDEDLPFPYIRSRCIEEIRQLLKEQDDAKVSKASISSTNDTILMERDRTLTFGSGDIQILFNDFLHREREISESLLPDTPRHLRPHK